MPQRCRNRRADQRRFSQVQEAYGHYGQAAFGDVAQQGQQAGLFPGAARDVRGADIAAADLAKCYSAPPGDEHARGD